MPQKTTSSKQNKNNKSTVKTTQKIVALNFRVPFDFKRNFKIAAATHGITQSDLLQHAFEEWNKKN